MFERKERGKEAGRSIMPNAPSSSSATPEVDTSRPPATRCTHPPAGRAHRKDESYLRFVSPEPDRFSPQDKFCGTPGLLPRYTINERDCVGSPLPPPAPKGEPSVALCTYSQRGVTAAGMRESRRYAPQDTRVRAESSVSRRSVRPRPAAGGARLVHLATRRGPIN